MTRLEMYRGLPSSGKSTAAQRTGMFHVEADMYFVKNGVYTFDSKLLKPAHLWCFNTVREALLNGVDTVVSNTFSRLWEMEPYLDLVRRENSKYKSGCAIQLKVWRCWGRYSGNKHHVPEEVIQRMTQRFEDYNGEVMV